MLQNKKEAIRAQIRQEHLTAYFSRIRSAKIQQLSQGFPLETKSEEAIIMEAAQKTHGDVDFNRLYHYLRFHQTSNEEFVLKIAKNILDHYRSNLNALYVLCLLLQTNQHLRKLIGQNSNLLNLLLVDNLQDTDRLQCTLLILFKVLLQTEQKEVFAWLPQYYSIITERMGCSNIFMVLLSEASRCSLLIPNIEVARRIVNTEIEQGNEEIIKSICEVLQWSFHWHPIADYFQLLVVMVATHTKGQKLTISLHDYLLHTLATLLSLDPAKRFIEEIVRSNYEIIPLLLLSLNGSSRARISVIACLCGIINNTSKELLLPLLERHPVGEPLARAFELSLDNNTKFQLLCSILILFEICPESIREFQSIGGMHGIWECEYSPVQRLREMACFIIDNYDLNRP